MTAVMTWAKDWAEENAMNDDHSHLWRQMIMHVEEESLAGKTVLDYGCNQGGFLRLLHELKPFRRGTGTDIALESLAMARQRSVGLPLDFLPAAQLQERKAAYDVAFSHEVIYLLPDLAAHAALMRQVLRPGGVYYVAIGCHTGNPQWPRWRDIIAAYSNVPVQDYSLDDYGQAFFDAGFEVSARPYAYQGFVPLKRTNIYFPRIADSLQYHAVDKTLFRLVSA